VTDKLVSQIEDFISKQQGPAAADPPLDFVDEAKPQDTATAAQAPRSKGGAAPSGKVPTKIYEMVRRGGRVFERVRTAWVNPEVAERNEQSKLATDWIRTLGNYLPLYFVGGYVRDKFLKKAPADIDIISLIPLSQVRPILNRLNIRFTEHSNAHSRIKFKVGGLSVDVVSVQGDQLKDNLLSRDFTINAVAQSVTGQFFDPSRGLDDVKAKILRTPGGDPVTTFKNDPMRILRGIRFLSNYPLKIDSSIPSAVKETVDGLSSAKPRRIGFEFKKILQTEKPWVAAKLFAEWDVCKYISEDLNNVITLKQRGSQHRYNAWAQMLAALKKAKSRELVVNAAIMLSFIGKYKVSNGGKDADFTGWEEESAKMAHKVLLNLGFSKEYANRIHLIIYNMKILSLENPSKDEYRKVALSQREDLENYFTAIESLIITSNIDTSRFAELRSNIERYANKNREVDGQELGTTSGVEKFDDTDKLLKASDIDLLREAGQLLGKI
tara:strand:+ start:561 stop:2048 length:1488 start_codon:yes stop_codon:yes gene_type:complete